VRRERRCCARGQSAAVGSSTDQSWAQVLGIGCMPVHTAGRLSGPHIRHAPAITRQICKGIKSIEMIDRQIGNAFRLREAHIHGSPVATIISGLNRNIVGHTAAIRAEMKVDSPSISSAIR
jgi:hypothetical protein